MEQEAERPWRTIHSFFAFPESWVHVDMVPSRPQAALLTHSRHHLQVLQLLWTVVMAEQIQHKLRWVKWIWAPSFSSQKRGPPRWQTGQLLSLLPTWNAAGQCCGVFSVTTKKQAARCSSWKHFQITICPSMDHRLNLLGLHCAGRLQFGAVLPCWIPVRLSLVHWCLE